MVYNYSRANVSPLSLAVQTIFWAIWARARAYKLSINRRLLRKLSSLRKRRSLEKPLSQASRRFGARYRGFTVFLARSNCLKNRQATQARLMWSCKQIAEDLENTELTQAVDVVSWRIFIITLNKRSFCFTFFGYFLKIILVSYRTDELREKDAAVATNHLLFCFVSYFVDWFSLCFQTRDDSTCWRS